VRAAWWRQQLIFVTPMKLNLPTPQPHHVTRYQELIFQLYGVSLSQEEAFRQCSHLVQYLFLTDHALPALRAQKQRE